MILHFVYMSVVDHCVLILNFAFMHVCYWELNLINLNLIDMYKKKKICFILVDFSPFPLLIFIIEVYILTNDSYKICFNDIFSKTYKHLKAAELTSKECIFWCFMVIWKHLIRAFVQLKSLLSLFCNQLHEHNELIVKVFYSDWIGFKLRHFVFECNEAIFWYKIFVELAILKYL